MPHSALPAPIALALRRAGHLEDGDAVEVAGRGREGTCYVVRKPHGAALLVKLYRPQSLLEQPDRAAGELARLREFGDRLGDAPRLLVPAPLALIEVDGSSGYVRRYVDGEPLVRRIVRARAAELRGISADLVRGLRLYHEAFGECFGEPGGSNVLVSPTNTLAFIDPGFPNEELRRARQRELDGLAQASGRDRLLAVDLGGWLASFSWWIAQRPTRLRHIPRVPLMMRLMLQAASAVVDDPATFAADAYTAAYARHGSLVHGVRKPWHIAMRALARGILMGTHGGWRPRG